MDIRNETRQLTASEHDLATAAALLRAGGLVAIPTETVYGLAADALNATAVERIFEAKQRPHWDPLIVHLADTAMLSRVACAMNSVARKLMDAFWPGPLTLLLPRQPGLPSAVTAGRELVGVRIPAHAVALALIRAAGTPLAAPSANRFGHVSPTTAAHVMADLHGRIDAIVDAGPCTIGLESTVAEPRPDGVILYRAGRVTASQIEQVTGVPVQVHAPVASGTVTPQGLPSPGVGMRHYATRAQVRLVGSEQELEDVLGSGALRGAAIFLPADWALPAHNGPVLRWAASTDAEGLANGLYDGLRALDLPHVHVILVPLPRQKTGLFAALRDRLEKASRPA